VAERTRELTAMNEALRESEERYRVLFDSAVEGILVAEISSRRFLYATSVRLTIEQFQLVGKHALRICVTRWLQGA